MQDLGLKSFPDYEIAGGKVESLLPSWFDKDAPAPDVDVPPSANAGPTDNSEQEPSANFMEDSPAASSFVSDVDGLVVADTPPDINVCDDVDGSIADSSSPVAEAKSDVGSTGDNADMLGDDRWVKYDEGDEPHTIMKYALSYAGIQHVIDNATRDTHESMKYWGEFYVGLEQCRGLLCVPERRKRFQWTCLRGHHLEAPVKHIRHFCGKSIRGAMERGVQVHERVVALVTDVVLNFRPNAIQ